MPQDTIVRKRLMSAADRIEDHPFSPVDDSCRDLMEAGPDSDTLLTEIEKPCGSMELGKQRNQDKPLATEPEKHLTPRATSKEFYFPKSN